MGALVTTIDQVLTPLKSWIAQFRDDCGRYRYLRDSRRPYCLYATLDGLTLAGLLGVEGGEASGGRGVVEFIHGCQSAQDGHFRCPTCAEADPRQPLTCSDATNRDGITFKAACALFMAGASPQHPLPDGDMLAGNIGRGLRSIFRDNDPYRAGAAVWKRTGMRSLRLLSEGSDPRDDPYVAGVMRWLVARQDEPTGLWFPEGNLVNGMNGLLKMRYLRSERNRDRLSYPQLVTTILLVIGGARVGRILSANQTAEEDESLLTPETQDQFARRWSEAEYEELMLAIKTLFDCVLSHFRHLHRVSIHLTADIKSGTTEMRLATV
jgi:hypothetical protein